MSTWRVGRHYPIHVYDGDRPVATFHTAVDARRAVAAVNSTSTDTSRVARDLTGICCDSHQIGPTRSNGMGWCCDTDDCGPCCEHCPTCPTCPTIKRMQTAPPT